MHFLTTHNIYHWLLRTPNSCMCMALARSNCPSYAPPLASHPFVFHLSFLQSVTDNFVGSCHMSEVRSESLLNLVQCTSWHHYDEVFSHYCCLVTKRRRLDLKAAGHSCLSLCMIVTLQTTFNVHIYYTLDPCIIFHRCYFCFTCLLFQARHHLYYARPVRLTFKLEKRKAFLYSVLTFQMPYLFLCSFMHHQNSRNAFLLWH